MNCTGLKKGDKVTRLLGGLVPMSLVVTKVDDELLYCGPWKFRRENGAEVDEDLNWDGIHETGSYLVEYRGEETPDEGEAPGGADLH